MPKSKEPEKKEIVEKKQYSRRDFLTISGAAVAAQALVTTTGCATVSTSSSPAPEAETYPESDVTIIHQLPGTVGVPVFSPQSR